MTRPLSVVGGRLRRVVGSRISGILLVSRTVIARAVSIAAAAALSVVVARVLGPSQAGVFFVLLATLTGAATLGRFGTDNMALKWVATSSQLAGSRTTGLLWICTAFSTLTAVPLFWLVRWMIGSHVAPASLSGTALVAAASIVPAALSVAAGAVLRGAGKVASGTIAELGSTPAIATLALLGYTVFAHAGLPQVVLAYALGNLLTAAWSLPLAAKQLTRDASLSRSHPALDVARGHGRQLSSMMGTSLMFYLLTWSPVLILGAVAPSAEVAYFNVAARLAAFITLIPSIQAAYLTPRFALLHYRGDLEDLNQLVQMSTRRAVLVGGGLAAPILLFPTQALLLFGSDYAPAEGALRVLTLAAVIVVSLGPVNGLLLTCGFEHFASLLNGISLTFAVVVMLMVASNGGAQGVAFVSGGVAMGYAAMAAWRMKSKAGIVAPVAFSFPVKAVT